MASQVKRKKKRKERKEMNRFKYWYEPDYVEEEKDYTKRKMFAYAIESDKDGGNKKLYIMDTKTYLADNDELHPSFMGPGHEFSTLLFDLIKILQDKEFAKCYTLKEFASLQDIRKLGFEDLTDIEWCPLSSLKRCRKVCAEVDKVIDARPMAFQPRVQYLKAIYAEFQKLVKRYGESEKIDDLGERFCKYFELRSSVSNEQGKREVRIQNDKELAKILEEIKRNRESVFGVKTKKKETKKKRAKTPIGNKRRREDGSNEFQPPLKKMR